MKILFAVAGVLLLAFARRKSPTSSAGDYAPPGDLSIYWRRAPATVKSAIMRNFPRRLWHQFAALAYFESSFNPRAVADIDQPKKGFLPETSIGLWQINIRAWPRFRSWNLYDPNVNAKAARIVYDAQGFRAWLLSSRKAGLL